MNHTKTKKRNITKTSTHKFKNSIYYNTKNFDKLAKYIIDTNLIDSYKETNFIDKELDEIMNTTNDKSNNDKSILIAFDKKIKNGKKDIKGQIIIEDNKMIKKYSWNNGKSKLKKIKKMI